MLLSGTRAGIFEGDLAPLTNVEFTTGLRLMVPLPVGVFAKGGGGLGAFMTLPPRIDCGGLVEFGRGIWGPDGVLDLGGAFTVGAAISSRYLLPCTRKGLPYSSSHLSKAFLNSASTFGNSLAIRFLIFSSLSNRAGSRLSPLLPRAIRRDAS